MTIQLYNTATRRKEMFQPVREEHVGMYVCGVTVYDLCHMGHARSVIFFDVLYRYLQARGFHVTYVRNFTDVDDKIIDRARELNKNTTELAQEYIDAFYEDMGVLGVLNADHEPRATQHIHEMIQMIETLMEKGYAYREGGDVFYAVEKLKDYGILSGRRLEDMKAGSRIAVDEKKRHPMDFVLWKGAKEGEPWWPSPWGQGRPGWHMECSVMSTRFLGPTFDIHGGGEDLLFPHHENERAQSLAANEGEFAHYWVHNGFVTMESEKMSKSVGNFLTIRDALKTYHPEVLRLFLLSKHYRSPIDFSRKALLGFQSGLIRIYRTLQRMYQVMGEQEDDGATLKAGILAGDQEDPFVDQFVRAMDDDINTAGAIGLLFEKIKEINRSLDTSHEAPDESLLNTLKNDRSSLLKAASVLGLLSESSTRFFERVASPSEGLDAHEIERMIEERSQARAAKDWARADSIRKGLTEMGIVLEDGPRGTTWRFDIK